MPASKLNFVLKNRLNGKKEKKKNNKKTYFVVKGKWKRLLNEPMKK
jgi:hypothetical protein